MLTQLKVLVLCNSRITSLSEEYHYTSVKGCFVYIIGQYIVFVVYKYNKVHSL